MNKRNSLTCIATIAALSLAGCASTSPGYGTGSGYGSGYGNTSPASRCRDCGTVTSIQTSAASGGTNVVGPVLGGIVGAVAAKELARKNTDSEGRRNVATVAGAAGGAVAGNAIQNRVEGNRGGYVLYVRMDDGRTTTVHQDDIRGIREGSYVRVQNGYASLY